jgi:hypothetical protein
LEAACPLSAIQLTAHSLVRLFALRPQNKQKDHQAYSNLKTRETQEEKKVVVNKPNQYKHKLAPALYFDSDKQLLRIATPHNDTNPSSQELAQAYLNNHPTAMNGTNISTSTPTEITPKATSLEEIHYDLNTILTKANPPVEAAKQVIAYYAPILLTLSSSMCNPISQHS